MISAERQTRKPQRPALCCRVYCRTYSPPPRVKIGSQASMPLQTYTLGPILVFANFGLMEYCRHNTWMTSVTRIKAALHAGRGPKTVGLPFISIATHTKASIYEGHEKCDLSKVLLPIILFITIDPYIPQDDSMCRLAHLVALFPPDSCCFFTTR